MPNRSRGTTTIVARSMRLICSLSTEHCAISTQATCRQSDESKCAQSKQSVVLCCHSETSFVTGRCCLMSKIGVRLNASGCCIDLVVVTRKNCGCGWVLAPTGLVERGLVSVRPRRGSRRARVGEHGDDQLPEEESRAQGHTDLLTPPRCGRRRRKETTTPGYLQAPPTPRAAPPATASAPTPTHRQWSAPAW
jgi:hypothetical protein